MNKTRKPQKDIPPKDIPPAVHSDDPEAELEEELREHPSNASTKVDVGSDESMDASDPLSIVRPGSSEPAPSSGSPKERKERHDRD